jgi:CheY-like chemotaxis protein
MGRRIQDRITIVRGGYLMSNRTILIVDDNANFLKVFALKIAQHYPAGRFLTAQSGFRALELIETNDIDLLITDVYMPKMHGFDLLLKARRINPQLKVIMMTAYYSRKLHDKAFQYGSLAYIEKPFKIEQMLDLIVRTFEVEKRKFTGDVVGIEVSDIVQLNCLAKLDNTVFFTSNDKTGIIFFEKGEIVHAVCGEQEGEEALRTIVAFDGGSFYTRKNLAPPKKTVNRKWEQLLLELFVSLDEEKAGRPGHHDFVYRENIDENNDSFA